MSGNRLIVLKAMLIKVNGVNFVHPFRVVLLLESSVTSMKNSVLLTLIAFSVALLLALQGLWLTNSYEKAYLDLRREANTIFRSTVFQLRDTIFVNTLQPRIDSTGKSGLFISSNRWEPRKAMTMESDCVQVRRKAAAIQVYISSSEANDSLIKTLSPLTNRLQAREGQNQFFSIRIAPDSLNVDSLTVYFQRNIASLSKNLSAMVRDASLEEFRLGMPFDASPSPKIQWRMEHKESDHPRILLSDSLFLEPVRINPHRRYTASLVGIRPLVFSEITPQILFSFILTLTILAAFVFMYRNIRSQQKLMIQKNDFISNITHELKTPVATVSVALEALQNFDATANPERSKEYLIIAQQELSRLTELTDKILKITVFEEQGSVQESELVNLNTVTANACSSLKLLLDKAKATLTLEATRDNLMVYGNSLHLTNSISNLVENAIKYSGEGVKIDIQLTDEKNHVRLSIKDSGIGIAEEYQKKIFDKFFRVPTGNVHKVKGYGLGLSYVANVITAHKGRIEINSRLGEGSEFIITLPLHS